MVNYQDLCKSSVWCNCNLKPDYLTAIDIGAVEKYCCSTCSKLQVYHLIGILNLGINNGSMEFIFHWIIIIIRLIHIYYILFMMVSYLDDNL